MHSTFPGNLCARSRIQPHSCRKSSSVEARTEHTQGIGRVFLKCCLGGNSKVLIPSPSNPECVSWRLSREMWKWDPTAVSGSEGKSNNYKEGVRRGIPELWDSSVGLGELQGKKELGKHSQDEEMPQDGVSMSPAICP